MSDEFHLPSLADESCSRYFSSVFSATKEFRNFLITANTLTTRSVAATFIVMFPVVHLSTWQVDWRGLFF